MQLIEWKVASRFSEFIFEIAMNKGFKGDEVAITERKTPQCSRYNQLLDPLQLYVQLISIYS